MKPLILKCAIVFIACLFFQCSMSHSGDIARVNEKAPSAQRTSEFLNIDPEWRIQLTRTSDNLEGQWEGSCLINGECWYWTSSKLFGYERKKLKEIQVPLRQHEYILDASPVSNGTGWVVTSGGLFQMSNSGSNWIHTPVPEFDPPKGRIHAVHFDDDKRGWIAGGVYRPLADREGAPNNALSDDRQQLLIGALARTLDGGLYWQTIPFPKSVGRFNEIVFSRQVGLISGDAGLEATTDGGESWKNVFSRFSKQNPHDRPRVNSTFVLDERHGWASISASQMLTTDDGARTWRLIPSADSGQDPPPLAEMAFIDDRRGLAVQSEFGAERIYKTKDGGHTWTGLELNTGLSGLVRVPGSNEIIAVGDVGVYSFTVN